MCPAVPAGVTDGEEQRGMGSAATAAQPLACMSPGNRGDRSELDVAAKPLPDTYASLNQKSQRFKQQVSLN